MIRFLLLLFFLSFFQEGNSQDRLDTIINFVIRANVELEGSVFIDTTYEKADILKLKKDFRKDFDEQISFIRNNGLELKDWSQRIFAPIDSFIRNRKEFWDELRKIKKHSSLGEDSFVVSNYENWLNKPGSLRLNPDSMKSYNKISSLIENSAWKKRNWDKGSKKEPKLLQILAIYESDKWYLILYQIMMVFGHDHYYPRSDLIFK